MLEFGLNLGIEPSYVRELVDEHHDDSQQFLVEVIHHWLQKHPEPDWWELEIAMDEILDYPLHHLQSEFAVHHALQTLMKEYKG